MDLPTEPVRVLVVEDDGIIAKGIERRLKRMEYDVPGTAMCGEEAVARALELKPDIILMDIQLGTGIDGIEAAHQIHASLDVPIIFLTAYSDDATISRAKETGPFGYVLKPYEDKDLQTSIEIGLYRHRMQRQLRENEQWLAATLASIGDGVIATDESGKVRLVNILAEKLTGWSQQDARGKHLVEVFDIVNEHTREPVPNPLLEVLATGKPGTLAPNTLLIDRNGRERPIDDSAAPIVGGDGELTGAVLVFRDITERRNLEELLRQTQKMESLGRLAGGIAHDFNNLLTVILGSCQMLLEDVPEEGPARETVESILEASRRAAALTEQITAFSRKQVFAPRHINVRDALSDLSNMLQRLVGSNIKYKLDIDSEPCIVHIDPAQFGQVVINLIVNARDAMREGGTLSVAVRRKQIEERTFGDVQACEPGPYVVIEISDTGVGMPPEVLERIFEPFFTTKEVGEGTGLGLATVYGIVHQSGGFVDASSEVGKGATFRVYIPEVEALEHDEAETTTSLARGSETVLLIEDSEQVRRLASTVLGNLGYRVFEASNGKEGVDKSAEYGGQIDLLLTDLVMPGMNGQKAASRIVEQHPETRVLYMSGYSDDVVFRQGVESSRVQLLRKPFTLEELAGRVRQVLDSDADKAPAG